MESTLIAASAESIGERVAPCVQLLSETMRIHDLSIERPLVIAYLQNIAPEKRAIALVHAIEVGVTEMLSRRDRLRA